jgi:hypothetical protein
MMFPYSFQAFATLLFINIAPVVAEDWGPPSNFGLASLTGDYAYSNRVSGVGSYGIMTFDGKGSVTMEELRVNSLGGSTPGAPRNIVSLGGAEGTYEIGPLGDGTAKLEFDSDDLEFEFVVVKSGLTILGKKQALVVDAFLKEAGSDGQLVAPTWSKI